VIKEVNSCCR